MGVKGFWSYVKKVYPSSLEDQYLSNCTLILDGNNIAHSLFTDHKSNVKYGGDYYGFDEKVKDFFNALLSCNISVMVIFDGSYDSRKFEKKCENFTRNCAASSSGYFNDDTPWKYSDLSNIFVTSVFTDVLIDMNIKYCKVDLEADEEIVYLANKFGGYVLSNDSDFCFYDIRFVPMSYLNYKDCKTLGIQDSKNSLALKGKIFSRSTFSNITGIKTDLIPLIPILVGNDHSSLRMEPFFRQASISTGKYFSNMNNPHQLLGITFSWLRMQHGDQSSVFKKIISISNFVSSEEKKLKECLEDYMPKYSSVLPYFQKHESFCSIADQSLKHGNINVPPFVRNSFKCICTNRNSIFGIRNLPYKFVYCYRYNLINKIISDFFYHNRLFTGSLVEVSTKESIYMPLLGVLRCCQAIFVKSLKASLKQCSLSKFSVKGEKSFLLEYCNTKVGLPECAIYIRKGHGTEKLVLPEETLISYSYLPSLYETESMTSIKTKDILLKALGISIDFDINLPSRIHYIMIVISFWYKKYDISTNILDSVFLTFIILFLSNYNYVKSLFDNNCDNALSPLLETLSKNDCHDLNCRATVLHQESMQMRALYDLQCIHAFSCYQTTITMLNLLNSLLGFPFPITSICKVWSGTICYNIYLKFRSNTKENNAQIILANDSFYNIHIKMRNILYKALNINL